MNLCFVKPLNFLHPSLVVYHTKNMGRGVFTEKPIAAKTVIEISPVIVMSGDDRKHLDETLLHDYIFEWGDKQDQCCMALGYVPLYNHSYDPNCEYEMNFTKQIITVRTLRPVKTGEELKFNYNGDNDKDTPVWFDTK